jgi:hypothetical protein
MTTFNLFSKRQKRLRGEISDIYSYDFIPSTLRVQVMHIITDAIGGDIKYYGGADLPAQAYKFIQEALLREYGLHYLHSQHSGSREDVLNFLLTTEDYERVLDVIEFIFRYIQIVIKKDTSYSSRVEVNITPDDAIEDLNERFRENSIGYQFVNGSIIKLDSTFIHAEVVLPTLNLLNDIRFKGANEEYLKAHEHYKLVNNKECLTECLKAFESTMKIIFTNKGWAFNSTDTAKKLIQVAFQNSLVPTYIQNQFTSLQNLLESGIPTIRNKVGGHGQGATPSKVDDGLTRYGLNLTGANIIFLIEQSQL